MAGADPGPPLPAEMGGPSAARGGAAAGSGDRDPGGDAGLGAAVRLRAVYAAVFVIAACGLGYEIAAGALASYLLGDSVTQFSTAIGLYLSALGLGAWLSKFIDDRLVERFVDVQCAVALIGGTLGLMLVLTFPLGRWFRPVLWAEILGTGTLVGLEIPLLLRILEKDLSFKLLVSRVLTFDYIGALAVALLFPLVLVPMLQLPRTTVALGLANAFVGLWTTYLFEARIARPGPLRLRCALVIGVLTVAGAAAERLTTHVEAARFGGEVIFATSTPHQRIVLTQSEGVHALWLNGALQYSSDDEYRYHEALVHPAMASAASPRRVLVCGGGDGLAVREVLRHPEVERVVLVDLDPEMTRLAREHDVVSAQNGRALHDPRVEVVNDDAMAWLAERRALFDVAVLDFPDPAGFSVGKLYTTRFYERLLDNLAPDGVVACQATSILHTREAFWCIARTQEAVGLSVRPYRAFVPSFHGDWGFLLASRRTLGVPDRLPPGVRSLDAATMRALFHLPPDLGPLPVEVNRLDTQRLVRYYEGGRWRTSGG